jgi:hypothetical protein
VFEDIHRKFAAGCRARFGAFVLIAFLSAFSAPSEELNTAKKHLAQLREQARTAGESGDKEAYLRAVLSLQRFLNDRPTTVEAAAQAYADLGDTSKALAALKQFADAGQTDDTLISRESEAFPALEKLPEYQSILKRMDENKATIERAEPAFDLPGAGLLAEDIDYDSQSKTFLITSVLKKKIIRINQEGKAANFAESPSHWPMLAIKVDARRKVVWATEVALDGFANVPKGEWGKSAVLCFALRSGALLHRIEGPPGSALGDLVVTREGTPIVSDGTGGAIYQVHGETLEPINTEDFISPQTAAINRVGEVFLPDYLRGIGVLDLVSKRVTWLKKSNGRYALNGIDGLYSDGDWLVATQNGTSPERVIRFRLDASHQSVSSEEIIERQTSTLGDPTHGVVVGDSFYYIANSGWDALDDHGNLKAGAKLTPAHIMRFHLKSRFNKK